MTDVDRLGPPPMEAGQVLVLSVVLQDGEAYAAPFGTDVADRDGWRKFRTADDLVEMTGARWDGQSAADA